MANTTLFPGFLTQTLTYGFRIGGDQILGNPDIESLIDQDSGQDSASLPIDPLSQARALEALRGTPSSQTYSYVGASAAERYTRQLRFPRDQRLSPSDDPSNLSGFPREIIDLSKRALKDPRGFIAVLEEAEEKYRKEGNQELASRVLVCILGIQSQVIASRIIETFKRYIAHSYITAAMAHFLGADSLVLAKPLNQLYGLVFQEIAVFLREAEKAPRELCDDDWNDTVKRMSQAQHYFQQDDKHSLKQWAEEFSAEGFHDVFTAAFGLIAADLAWLEGSYDESKNLYLKTAALFEQSGHAPEMPTILRAITSLIDAMEGRNFPFLSFASHARNLDPAHPLFAIFLKGLRIFEEAVVESCKHPETKSQGTVLLKNYIELSERAYFPDIALSLRKKYARLLGQLEKDAETLRRYARDLLSKKRGPQPLKDFTRIAAAILDRPKKEISASLQENPGPFFEGLRETLGDELTDSLLRDFSKKRWN